MDYLLNILVITGIYTILTLSLNLVLGYTGIPSLGHAAFYCIGAYTSSLLALNFGVSPWIGLWAGAALACLLGILISLPALRLKGDYLALATFGFGVIVYSITKNWVDVTRGTYGVIGIPGFALFSWQISSVWAYLILVSLFVVLTYFILNRVVNSPFGRVLRAIREDETAVLAMGRNINHYKVLVMAISAFFAGIAGSLYAHFITFIDPSSFTLTESLTVLLMVVFGGMGSLQGSVVGAISLVILPEALRFLGVSSPIAAPLRQIIYGFLLVFLMMKRPQGILGQYQFK
jgi:branched-chain amino acid transport system permease protein